VTTQVYRLKIAEEHEKRQPEGCLKIEMKD